MKANPSGPKGLGSARRVSSVARLGRGINHGRRRAPCIRLLAEPTRLTWNYSDRLLGVVAALAAEARALERRSSGSAIVACLSDGTLVAVSGMGGAAAALAAARLIERGLGTHELWAGGRARSSLSAGSVVFTQRS